MKKAAVGALLGATMLASTPSMAATNITSGDVISALGLQMGASLFRVAETSYGQFLLDLGNLMAQPDSYNAVKTAFGVTDGAKVSIRYVPSSGRGWSTLMKFDGSGNGSISTVSSSGAPGLFSGTPAVAPGPIAGAGIPAALALFGIGGYLKRRRSPSA